MTASVYGKLIDVIAYDHAVIAGMRIERPITVPTHAWEEFWQTVQNGTVEDQTVYDDGYDDGYLKGREIGYDVGYSEGRDVGYDEGLEDGLKESSRNKDESGEHK